MFFAKTVGLLTLLTTGASAATVDFIDLFRTGEFNQTSAAQPASANFWFFASRVHLANAGDFDNGTMTPPGGSALPLSVNDPITLGYGSPAFATLADLNAQLPLGTYLFHVADSTAANGPQDLGVDMPSDNFAGDTPYVTNYTALQTLNTSAPFLVNINPFTNAASVSFVFFTLTRQSDSALVFDAGFLPSSTTSVNIPAGTLDPSTAYSFHVYFSNRALSSYEPRLDAGNFVPQLGSDLVTSGEFTTAALSASTPEPGSVLLTLAGGALLVVLRRRRSLRRPADSSWIG